jgi:hypothetical protein
MTKVEIGPLATRAGLIAAAIDRLIPRGLAAEMPRPVIRAASPPALANEISPGAHALPVESRHRNEIT